MSDSAPSLVIRPIRIEDAEPVAQLCGELGYPVQVETMRQRIGCLNSAPDHAVYVACDSVKLVGWIDVSIVHHLQADPRGEIGGLIVSSQNRNSGIGRRLVAEAERWVAEQRVDGIVVRSQIAREAAHRFYLREGYTRTKTSAVFSKPLK